LRRHGPAKATVVDVARALGVSHAAVYRHFATKAALREAVTRRWLERSYDRLAAIAQDAELPPPSRLRAWLSALFAAKRAKALDDPELTATYAVLVAEHSHVATEHVAHLLGQLTAIVTAGAATGDFAAPEPRTSAQAVFDATSAFHHPAHADSWQDEGVDAAFDAVCDLLLAGLRAGLTLTENPMDSASCPGRVDQCPS
jgi:AcrR family transcriptional regulator